MTQECAQAAGGKFSSGTLIAIVIKATFGAGAERLESSRLFLGHGFLGHEVGAYLEMTGLHRTAPGGFACV